MTPTNLLYNVVSGPGALARYRRQRQLAGPLARQLLAGTLPGVVVGAVLRVYLVPGPQLFRLVAAAVLLPIGVWLCLRTVRGPSSRPARALRARAVGLLGLLVAVVGGVYGIGGGRSWVPSWSAPGCPSPLWHPRHSRRPRRLSAVSPPRVPEGTGPGSDQ